MGRTYLITLFLFTLLLVGCSSSEWENAKEPEQVYKAITELVNDDDYFEAREAIDSLKKRFPQSRFVKLADLRLADVEFQEDNFTEAAAIYGVFVDLHPKDPEAHYALYRRALSFYNEAPSTIARDQSSCTEAVASANRLISRYPESIHIKEAREIVFKARLKLAKKEAYIARFYERKNKNLSAKRRWLQLLASYSDLEDSNDKEAKDLIARAKKRAQHYSNLQEQGES